LDLTGPRQKSCIFENRNEASGFIKHVISGSPKQLPCLKKAEKHFNGLSHMPYLIQGGQKICVQLMMLLLVITALQRLVQSFDLNNFFPPSSIPDKGSPIWHF
jgi:hypothetical protein